MWDLSSSTIQRTHTPCIGRWSLTHRTTKEVPRTTDFFKGAGTARMPGGRVLFSQKRVLLVGKFSESGSFKVRNWGRASVLHVLSLLGNSKEPALCFQPAEALPACWCGLGTSATPRPSISTLPSRAHRARLLPWPSRMAGPTSQHPAYLPVCLTGDFIGVAQNLQLHVRLEDPAAERRETKQQVIDFQWELADSSRETLHYTLHRLKRSLGLQMGCLGVGVGRGWATKPQG